MNSQRREQLQRSLRSLADSQVATMQLMEQTLSLLCDELALDPVTYFERYVGSSSRSPALQAIQIDRSVFSVRFQGKSCFLGNTRPFWFLCYLAKRPNTYLTYDELLAEVWNGTQVSDAAIRTVAKNLRKVLREAGMEQIAAAIDGTEYGHYALRLDPDW